MQKVELLAPAGKPEILKGVVKAGADAIYVGGKDFNMRQHRSDFNFDTLQLKQAVQYVHEKGKKLYVTVNALFKDEEFDSLTDYLSHLDHINVDAIIIQDMGLLHYLTHHRYTFDIHASTMINIHNIAGARLLKSKGVSRIVTSRDISLEQVMEIAQAVEIECEYFIHGDMCASQSGQCYSSGILFGQSSNRGRCLKPCRWPYRFYDMTGQNPLGSKRYYLARKDMCLIQHIDTLISKGIVSFKIEGRMKDEKFLRHIVMNYRNVIDKYYENPYLFNVPPEVLKDIHEHRVRDLSSCFAIKKAAMNTFALTGKREPKFFSRAVKEKRIEKIDVTNQNSQTLPHTSRDLYLTVHVSSLDTLKTALKYKPAWIYLDSTLPVAYWDENKMFQAIKMTREHAIPIALSIPSIITDRELSNLLHYLNNRAPAKIPDGFLAGNPGAIEALKNRGIDQIFGDYTLNVINNHYVLLLQELGVKRYCISLEFPFIHKSNLIECELLVHGPIPFMQFESCYIYNIKGKNADYCPGYCSEKKFAFQDEAGEIHELVPDTRCRNYFMAGTHLCLINSLHNLNNGIKYLRIDARLYDAHLLDLLLRYYGEAIKEIHEKGLYHIKDEVLNAIIKESPYPIGDRIYHRGLQKN